MDKKIEVNTITRGRPSRVEVFLMMAKELSRLSTCVSRNVGCVVVDKYNRIIATGYNGIPSGLPHVCLQNGCQRKDVASGEALNKCLATHAEINALMHCSDIKQIEAIFLFGPHPCGECAKQIANSGAKVVYFTHDYHSEHLEMTRNILSGKSIELTKVNLQPDCLEVDLKAQILGLETV